MAKFIMVTELPTDLKDTEMVIENPTFAREIFDCKVKVGVQKVTTSVHTRAILDIITFKYAPHVNPMHINISNFLGHSFQSNEELGKIIFSLLEKEAPQVIDGYIETLLKNRNANIETVYTTVSTHRANIFIKNGLDRITKKDLEEPKSNKNSKKQSDKNGV